MAILSAGVAIVTTAFALLTSPIGLVILAIVATIAIFKKFGGDLSVIQNGLMIMWEGYKMFMNYFKLGILKLLHLIPGVDMADKIKETEEDIVANKQAVADRANAITTTMEANRAKAEQERIAEEKGEGKQTSGLMDDLKGLFGPKGAAQAAAAQRHKDEKRAQSINFRNNKPGGFGGGGGGGGGAGAKDPKAAEGKPEIKMDYNASSESMLKQMAEMEGSALAVKPGAASPDTAKTTEALAAANASKKSMEADAQKKKQEEEAKKKTEEEKKKADEDAKKKKEEEEKNKKPESAETLLAELNTKMATLLKYTFTVAHNTNETVTATRGLNKNGFKS
jgi:hypothetical protein